MCLTFLACRVPSQNLFGQLGPLSLRTYSVVYAWRVSLALTARSRLVGIHRPMAGSFFSSSWPTSTELRRPNVGTHVSGAVLATAVPIESIIGQ